jgi:RNA polymerase sigma-70 factor (sigma-E family)
VDEDIQEFVRARHTTLLRRAYLLTGNREAAADLVQDALVRCCVAWRRRPPDNPEAYVLKVMVNRQISRWHRRRTIELPMADLPEQPGPEAVRDEMWAMLQNVAPRQRAVLVLRYYEGMTEGEIADVLGISVGTVRSQNAKGLARLRMALVNEEERA